MTSLFKTPKAPVIPPPAPMPVPDTVVAAKKKQAVAKAAQQRSGRSSTIMTDYGVQGSKTFG